MLIRDIIEYFTYVDGFNLPAAALLVVLLFLTYVYVNDKLNNASDHDQTTEQSNLLFHDFFIKSNKYYRIAGSGNFGDEVNNEIFRTVLTNRVMSALNVTKEMILSVEFDKLTTKELECALYMNNDNIITDYNENIKNDLCVVYGQHIGVQLYNRIMNASIVGFNIRQSAEYERLECIISNVICKDNSVMYPNNVARVETYLQMLNTFLFVGMSDIETEFGMFNGDLVAIKNNMKPHGD